MQGLDPLMDGILEKMNEVTDHSRLRELQSEDRLNKAELKVKDVVESAREQGIDVTPTRYQD